MERITVQHQSVVLNWNKIKVENPKTLVLGSFNPFESKLNSVDYYYGRSKNHFWKSIATIIGKDENWFFCSREGLNRKIASMKNSFICFDVIENIEISSNNLNDINSYIESNIYNNFLDSKIWTTKTTSPNGNQVLLERKYNQYVIDYLKKSGSISKVIHTMGVNRLSVNKTSPKEKNLNKNGFGGYIDQISSICREKNIEFIFDSLSPSDYAIKSGKVTRNDLEVFLNHNIPLSFV
ncbi:MAG: hypothetical protein RL108_1537 [Bacteroidota bacterium]|jgi:hypothetical protein